MSNHTVTGGGGVRLHVEEAGNPNGKPILFIPGLSQSHLVWSRQMQSDLARDFRLVAMDIRGHGQSDKPRDAYGDAKLWADDVHAVIRTLGLAQPVLTCWSYGGVIISDYVAHYGEDEIAGTHWVGAVSRLGEPVLAGGFLAADFLALIPGLLSNDAEESGAALQRFVRTCFASELTESEFYLLAGANAVVPPYVRQGLFARTVDNDAVVQRMRKPLLLTYTDRDRIVSAAMGRHLLALAPNARLAVHADAGHGVFWDDTEYFNRATREFRASV